MTFNEKVKTIDNKNEQNKTRYHLDRYDLSVRYVGKYNPE